MARDKILLALQFYWGDRDQAMYLARLIARLEPRHCDLADFLFVARNDTPHDKKVVKEVSRSFNTFTYTAKNRGRGWPHGPNTLWFDAMGWVYCHQDYKAVLTFEADACPLVPDWIARLSDEWDKAHTSVLGAMLPYPVKHINGNALFCTDPKFLHWLTRQVSGAPGNCGWDTYLAKAFESRGWKNTPLIRSHWRSSTISALDLQGLVDSGVVFLHGVKDYSVQEFVRSKYLCG